MQIYETTKDQTEILFSSHMARNKCQHVPETQIYLCLLLSNGFNTVRLQTDNSVIKRYNTEIDHIDSNVFTKALSFYFEDESTHIDLRVNIQLVFMYFSVGQRYFFCISVHVRPVADQEIALLCFLLINRMNQRQLITAM